MPENQCKFVSVVSEEEKKQRILELKIRLQDAQLTQFPYDDAYLERFLGGTDFDVEKAFDRIKTYYELLLEFPEWFTKESPLSKKELIEKDIRVVLPETDKAGRPIYVVKLGKVNVDTMKLLDIIAVDDMWIELILLNHIVSQKGLCVIIDIADFPWKQIKWVTPHNIKMGLKKLQCLPFKEYRFHVVNDSMMVHTAIRIIWPFLPEHIKEMVKFHFNDRAALHEFIDPEILPAEYGGTNQRPDNTELFDQLFAKNQQIAESFKVYRNVNVTVLKNSQ